MASSNLSENARLSQISEHENVNPVLENDDDEDLDEIEIGTKVHSEDEAYGLYCQHAIQKGFDVRKGNIRYGASGNNRQREYLYSNSGVSTESDPCELKRVINRVVKRSNCNAFIRFTVKDGIWEVSHFNNVHNHKFVTPEDQQFLKINRHINVANASVINSVVDAGIGGLKTYSYLAKEVGGAENVGFTQIDCQNFINRKKMNLIEKGDAQTVFAHFKSSLLEDPMFYHSEELDEDSRLANFFWRDGRSKLDYDCFGDVVIFDTTYRTNKYNMIFAPCVGINHHRKNIFFACAFLLNETTDTFIWLFEIFLEAMGCKAPKTIFTDQCQAMANAIEKVFLNTCHRLCSWHISKNATQKLGGLYSNSEFRGLFLRCLNDCETREEFEFTWAKMITRFDLAENRWLKMVYEVREKWCPTFSMDIFTCRIKSTQRSESMNNVLHKMSCKTINLTEFFHHYEEQCEKMRLAERQEDYRCKHGMPQIRVKASKILMQAANVYTINIYHLFAEEFVSSLTVHRQEVSIDGSIYTYHLNEEGHNGHHLVEFDSSTCSVVCFCKMFESKGWLCRHALKVLNVWSITKIPAKYILSRLTKYARKESPLQECKELHKKRKSSLTIERNNLVQLAYCAISHLVMTDEGKKVANMKVGVLWEEAKLYMDTFNPNKNNVSGDVGGGDISGNDCAHQEMLVLNPPCVREKGVTNARKKSYLEKKK